MSTAPESFSDKKSEKRAKPLDTPRVPPHSIEAEQAVLGSLMLSPRAWELVADRVAANDFYRDDHRKIFAAIRELSEGGKPVDAITVAEWFERHNEADAVEGGAYLTYLANSVASAANVVAYADIVRERSVLRQLTEAGNEIAGNAYRTEGRTAEGLLEEAEKKIFSIADQSARRRSNFISIQDALKDAFAKLEELQGSSGEITGLATGFNDLDRKTAGLQPGDLIIVAGRPSMGKTTFSVNMAENAAIRHKVPVVIFSMEMSALQLVMRMFSSLGQINQTRIRTGKLEDLDWPNLTSAMTMLQGTHIFIDETPGLSPSEMRARARRLKREHDIGLVVVDYLQLMQVPDSRENRATEISEISRSLKALAKELHVPVIALSQLNRSLEQRPNKRPVMADLRESGAIEQDADLILFIYRDEVYNDDSASKGKAEIIVGKHRNGSTGTIELAFQGEFLRFTNLAQEFYS
ncbi:MAG: replicative DNA helicase [Xanthomonadales bacterium]|jgi:replicative DNA helicase|nr:replicative DNA helicase [Xanthomonadales bacterium]